MNSSCASSLGISGKKSRRIMFVSACGGRGPEDRQQG